MKTKITMMSAVFLLLSALLDQYINFRTGVYYPKEAEIFYSQHADKFRSELESKEKELIGLVGNTQIPDPQKEIEKNLFLKRELEQQLSSLRNESIEKRITIRHLEQTLQQKDIQYFSFVQSDSIRQLGVKLQELYVERGKTLRSCSEKSDKVRLIDKQLNDVYMSLRSEVTAYKDDIAKQLQIINAKIADIEDRIGTLNKKNVILQRQLVEQNRLIRDAKLNKFSYETFAKRGEESRINVNRITESNLANVNIFNKHSL